MAVEVFIDEQKRADRNLIGNAWLTAWLGRVNATDFPSLAVMLGDERRNSKEELTAQDEAMEEMITNAQPVVVT